MIKKYFFTLLLMLCFSILSFGQIVINEVDADTPGTDTAEFIELKWTPNTSLDGYVVVLFNGSTDTSYAAFDLDGKTTDVNGFFIIGNTAIISENDIDLGEKNILQNGPDAVAIYQASISDFPDGTAVTTTGLIDAIVYDTNDADDAGLLTGLGKTVQYNEKANDLKDTQSIQRLEDGSYTTSNSTFRAENAVSDPCVLSLGAISAACNASTSGTDTYTGTIAFTGGNTGIVYTIATDTGTIGGDDPNSVAEGTITLTNLSEGINANVTIKGGSGSSCDFSRTINAPTCLPAPTCPSAGALIITEIMQNPTTANDIGEYFEVYNSSDSSIDIQGWVIKSISTSSKDHVISTSLVIPSKGYIVLGKSSDTNENGGVTVDYQYSSNVYLGNSSDSIALECDSTIMDSVEWDNGTTFPDPNGKSMELATNKYSTTDNDDGANWAEATAAIVADGDLGTPGAVNNFVLSTIRNNIKGFSTYPNPVTNNQFTLTSANSNKKEVAIFNVLGKKVLTTIFSGTKSNIDVSSIATGIYILKVTENGKSATKKLVIR